MKKRYSHSLKLILLFFIIIQFNCFAQKVYNKELLCKTWKLQSSVTINNKGFKDLERQDSIYISNQGIEKKFIKFNKDSTYEGKSGDRKSEGIWYFSNDGIIIECLKPKQRCGPISFYKIKELNSNSLILICSDIEGDETISTYIIYREN